MRGSTSCGLTRRILTGWILPFLTRRDRLQFYSWGRNDVNLAWIDRPLDLLVRLEL